MKLLVAAIFFCLLSSIALSSPLPMPEEAAEKTEEVPASKSILNSGRREGFKKEEVSEDKKETKSEEATNEASTTEESKSEHSKEEKSVVASTDATKEGEKAEDKIKDDKKDKSEKSTDSTKEDEKIAEGTTVAPNEVEKSNETSKESEKSTEASKESEKSAEGAKEVEQSTEASKEGEKSTEAPKEDGKSTEAPKEGSEKPSEAPKEESVKPSETSKEESEKPSEASKEESEKPSEAPKKKQKKAEGQSTTVTPKEGEDSSVKKDEESEATKEAEKLEEPKTVEAAKEEKVETPIVKSIGTFFCDSKNAKGLYASANELVRYCLPHRTFKELIEILWCAKLQSDKRQEIRKNHSINVSLKTKDSWELYDKCSGEKLVDVLSNCLFLFHTVYDIRSIPHLFSLDEVREFDRINDAATQLLDQIGSDGLKKKLPKVVLEMFGQEVDAKESAENFTESIEQLISKITANDFDIFEMRKLVEFDLTGKQSQNCRACTVLPMVQSIVDFRVANEFLKVLKRIACSCKDWSAMMTYFYGEFREVNGDLKTFKQFYQNFDEDMKNLVNNLGDHAQLHTNQVKLEEAVDESAWLLMISPMDTIISLFLQCLENILMVPNLIRILRKLPKYCDIELEAVSEEDSSTRSKTPILMFALRHILTVERSSIQSDAKRRNFIYMCAALCRERYALLKDGKNEAEKEENDSSETSAALFGGILDFALVDGSLVLNYLVLPALKQMFYQEIAVEIGRKLLTTVGARRTPIIWRAEQGIKLTEAKIEKNSGVSILQLFSILLNIINENKDTGDYALVNSCEDCLRLLGERLNEDGVIIRTDAFDNLLICFDKSLWAYRYALASWFYKCLESYERRLVMRSTFDFTIPSLLYDALKEEKRQTLKAVKTAADDSDISGRSLLRKLFQLATIQPDLALDMINDGLSTAVSIAGYDISGALVDVIRDHDNFPNNKIGGLVEIIKVIANQIDLSRQTAPLLTEISESSFYGLRLIEPLLLIQEAVICAIYYDRKSTDDLSAVPFNVLETENQVALKLLKLFCELVKDHMQKEMIDLRRSHMKYKVEIKEPRSTLNNVNINREIRVETQLVQLYIAAVILANHITGLPSYLKILLVQLTNFHIEMGRMKLGPTFDEMTNKALLVQDAKEKTIDDKLSSEQLAAASDSDQQLTSPEVNDCSIRNSAGSNTECETNRMADIKNADVGGIRESAKDHLLETSGQNAIFMASTQMIKDRSVSAIIENHLRRSKPSNKRRSAAGPKPRRGALPPLSATDNIHNIHNGNEERYFDDRSYTGCGYNNDGSNGRNSGFRRKNKNTNELLEFYLKLCHNIEWVITHPLTLLFFARILLI
ncbi:hypothetical protein DINM_007136 [Dirofilaria immitis]|nr:hypothetical protein [Dirofilaria immitis]